MKLKEPIVLSDMLMLFLLRSLFVEEANYNALNDHGVNNVSYIPEVGAGDTDKDLRKSIAHLHTFWCFHAKPRVDEDGCRTYIKTG